MKQDRIRWNEKHRKGDHPTEAADVVKRFYTLAPGKKALDIAAGNGRNAVFLARKGFSVDAVDISEVGLSKFAGRHRRIDTIRADLDQYEIARAHYDLIVNVKYLNRHLFPRIREGLKPGGVLIFHTLLVPDAEDKAPQHCRDYLLRQNELLHAFLSMRIVYYQETDAVDAAHASPAATLVAVK